MTPPPEIAGCAPAPQVAANCVQTWAWYWVVYNRAMLQEVDGWYRVEDTPPSRVRSGLTDPHLAAVFFLFLFFQTKGWQDDGDFFGCCMRKGGEPRGSPSRSTGSRRWVASLRVLRFFAGEWTRFLSLPEACVIGIFLFFAVVRRLANPPVRRNTRRKQWRKQRETWAKR